jgi:hypothetical protein
MVSRSKTVNIPKRNDKTDPAIFAKLREVYFTQVEDNATRITKFNIMQDYMRVDAEFKKKMANRFQGLHNSPDHFHGP